MVNSFDPRILSVENYKKEEPRKINRSPEVFNNMFSISGSINEWKKREIN